jgi:hypothetical protein
LGIAIPHGYFLCFANDAVWLTDEIERRAKLADEIESKGNMWNERLVDDMEFGDFFS